MYDITVILTEERVKNRLKAEKTISGEDRKELQEKIPDVIRELCGEDNFKAPTAEYCISRDGTYIDGEVDIRVKINRNGVGVKLSELMI